MAKTNGARCYNNRLLDFSIHDIIVDANIAGNNITARAIAWYMEKALHGLQTITDGCAFQINRVIKSRYTLTNKKVQLVKKQQKTSQ